MTGVTTIAEHAVKNYGVEYLLISVLFGIATILLLYILCNVTKQCVITYFDTTDWAMIAFISLACLCFGAGCVISAKGYADKTTHMEYTVTIDDTASFNEVNRTYDILSEEDGVYRVKLKEDAQ